MLIREIYRKLPKMTATDASGGGEWRAEDQEDILVSEAFGALRYLPRRRFLKRLLERIRRVSDGEKLQNSLLSGIENHPSSFDILFWPGYSVPTDFPENFAWSWDRDVKQFTPIRSVEPDCVITPSRGARVSGPLPLVFVEAKWKGSDLGSDCSQLARQYMAGIKMELDESAIYGREVSFLQLCITQNADAPLVCQPELSPDGKAIIGSARRTVLPHEQVGQYLSLYARYFAGLLNPAFPEQVRKWAAEAGSRVFHVSWREVAKVIEDGCERMKKEMLLLTSSKSETQDIAEGASLLAEEACHLLVDLRDLRDFRGFHVKPDSDLQARARDGVRLFNDPKAR